MNRLFYLFSESKKLEAIYLCEDGNYIDKPNLKTGVYPMGTLLSRAVYLLLPWYEEKLNLAKKDEIIALILNTSPDYESSFSSAIYKDSMAQVVFEMLIKNQEYKQTQGHFDKSNTKLKVILDYIQELQGDIYGPTVEKLTKKLNRFGYVSPNRNLWIVNPYLYRKYLAGSEDLN